MMRSANWLFIVAGTVIMIFVMIITGTTLKTPATPLGILNLEFAYTKTKADQVINSWKPLVHGNQNNIAVAVKNTWLDFIFLFFYSLFLFYTCKSIAESYKGLIHKLGVLLALGALNAGLFDIFENTGMLFMLNGFTSDSFALFTTISSTLKWTLALLALAYTILFGPLYLWRKLKRR